MVRLARVALGLLGICGMGLGLWWAARPAGPPARGAATGAAAAAAATARVPWSIVSEPPGASVVRIDDNQTLCQTPCQRELAAQAEPVRLRLQRAGYLDRTIVVDGSRPVQRHEILDPAPPAASLDKPPAEPTRPAAAGASKSSRDRRGASSPSVSSGAPAAGPATSPADRVTPKPVERANVRPKIED